MGLLFERVFYFALLVLGSFGLPLKGSKSTDQSSIDTHDSSYYASNPRVASDYAAPVQYSTARIMSQPVQFFVQEPSLSHEVAEAAPALGTMSSATADDFYSTGSDSSVQAEQADSTQPEAAQSGMPEARWLVPPQSFEEASIDAQAQSTSELFPQPPLPPAGPVLQSGETSNVVKEAELGNYQQQIEEFGYPADLTESQQSSTNVVLPSVVLPGYWGNSYPGFDYRLLYGLYPPGTYSTFSQSHERGKDYYKDVHYLKEHESEEDDLGPYQQKIFPGPPQHSSGMSRHVIPQVLEH